MTGKRRVRVGEIEFVPVGKEFYCRHCEEYGECVSHHRSGMWFATKAVTERGTIYFILGEGEREERFPFNIDPGKVIKMKMSGAIDYERGYKTCGGWYSLKVPVFLDEFEEQEVELSEDEKILLASMLNEQRVKILTELLRRNLIYSYSDLGVWNDVKPLLYTFLSERVTKLPLGAEIQRAPYSFKALFIFGNIKVTIPKKTRYNVYHREGLVKIVINDEKKLYYTEKHDRRIVYYLSGTRIFGFEEYRGEVSRCRIREPFYVPSRMEHDDFFKILFQQRLGDLLFLREKEAEILQPPTASEEHIKKLQVMNADIISDDITMLLKPANTKDIVLYHPDHGVLELPPHQYTIYRVPYERSTEG